MQDVIKIICVLGCGALNSWGGFNFHNARRYMMPVLLAITVSYVLHTWWLGVVILPIIATLVLGYKNFGSGHFSRGMWLFVQYVLSGLGLCLTGHLAWYFYAPYCVLGGVLGGSLVSLWQPLGDFIEGFFLGSILFLIH